MKRALTPCRQGPPSPPTRSENLLRRRIRRDPSSRNHTLSATNYYLPGWVVKLVGESAAVSLPSFVTVTSARRLEGPRKTVPVGPTQAESGSAATRESFRELYFPAPERGMAHYSFASPDRNSALLVEMNGAGDWWPCRLVSL